MVAVVMHAYYVENLLIQVVIIMPVALKGIVWSCSLVS